MGGSGSGLLFMAEAGWVVTRVDVSRLEIKNEGLVRMRLSSPRARRTCVLSSWC